MRVIRRVVGVLLAVAGLVVAVVGGVAAFWVIGPDDTVHSGEQHLSSKGLAVATTPELLNRNGPVLHVAVRSTKNQPVFVGVARDFDVASYLEGTGHTKLVQIQYPIALSTEDEKGTAGPLAAPATLDWWVAKANGGGTQSIAWPIEDGPYDVVIMNADGKSAPDVQADLGIEIPKAFRTALAVLASGILLLALGIFLILFRRRSARPHAPRTVPQAGVQGDVRRGSPGLRRAVAFAPALTLVTGCAAIPPADTVKVVSRPAVSDTTAKAVIDRFNAVNSKANATMDDKLIATVEGGNLLRQTQAWFEIGRTAKAKPGGTPTYTKSLIGSPRFSSYPMSFVSSSEASGAKGYRHLGVWERSSAGNPWMLTFASFVPTSIKLPDLSGLHVATRADDAKLAFAPQVAASGLATYLTEGPKSSHATAFQPNADITTMFAEMAQHKADEEKVSGSVRSLTNTFAVPPQSPAFVTKSGTAVVFVSLTHEYRLVVGDNWEYWWASFPEKVFSPATIKYQAALTSTTIHDAVLLVPPKGHGKIQVVSLSSQLVAAGGY